MLPFRLQSFAWSLLIGLADTSMKADTGGSFPRIFFPGRMGVMGGRRVASGSGWVFERQTTPKCCPTLTWILVPDLSVGIAILILRCSYVFEPGIDELFTMIVDQELIPRPWVLTSTWAVFLGDRRRSGLSLMGPFVNLSLELK